MVTRNVELGPSVCETISKVNVQIILTARTHDSPLLSSLVSNLTFSFLSYV
jgi:hypothetical protein